MSLALMVKLNVPAFEGEPVIFPVDVLSFKPLGRLPLLTLQT